MGVRLKTNRALIPFRSHAGLGMVEVITIVGLFSFVVLAIGGLNLQLSKQQNQSTSLVQLDLVRRNLIAIPLNSDAWKYTIAAPQNPNMACLKDNTPCTVDGSTDGAPLQNQLFALFDAGNQLFYDSTSLQNGFSFAGTGCKTFSQTGDDTCPFRFELTWSAICTPGNCIAPQVKINAPLSYKSVVKPVILNVNNFAVPDIYRAAQ